MNQPDDEPPSTEKPLRIPGFALHAARGLVRDQTMRRKTMFWVTLAAVMILFAGATFLSPILDPKSRPGWFIFYWLVCAWLTVTAVLLAVFDLLLVRAQARAEKQRLAERFSENVSSQDAD